MSVQALSFVLDFSQARLADRLVMIALANEANVTGLKCHPGQRRIAAQAHICRTHVRRSLQRLEAAGELLVLRPLRQGRGHYTRYAIVGGRGAKELAAVLGWPSPKIDPAVVAEFAERLDDVLAEDEGLQVAPLRAPTSEDLEREAIRVGRGPNRVKKGPPRDGPDPTDPTYPKTASDDEEERPAPTEPVILTDAEREAGRARARAARDRLHGVIGVSV